MIASVTPSCPTENRNRIKKLSPLLINQLAAGEVVTRPASVVKELVENAIDAGATEVTIRITQGGMGAIEVSDNGCGIHTDDMVMAVTRFATSKIADVAQLQGIATLGFRGEALAATAAVSRLTLRSSSDSSGVGRELAVAGILEDTPKLVPVVHPQGTTVIVKDLYFNVPARRGNLKSISTEFAHIEAVVKQLALVASEVAIGLWHNDKRRFYFAAVNTHSHNSSLQSLVPVPVNNTGAGTGSQTLQIALSRLKMIVPDLANGSGLPDFIDDCNQYGLQPLTISLAGLIADSAGFKSDSANSSLSQHDSVTATDIGIYGFLLPSLQASSTLYKLIYINGRLVKDKHIAHSVRTTASALTVLNDLGYVLFFQLPQAWLNVNVHPSKQCIKIQDLANISAHLEMGVKSSLQTWQKRLPDLTATSHAQSVISPPKLCASTSSFSALSSSKLLSSANRLPRSTSVNNFSAVNESQQVYRTQKQSPHPSLSRLRLDAVADDTTQQKWVKPQASIDSFVCVYRVSTAALNATNLTPILASMPQGKAKPKSKTPLEIAPDSIMVLVQWQAAFYLFDQQTLLAQADTAMHGLFVDGQCDDISLERLSARLTPSIAAMSAAERDAFSKQAVYKLSLAELTVLMLHQVL